MTNGPQKATIARLDELLNRFEACWRCDEIPAIAEYLEEANGFREELMRELVPIDLEYRWRNSVKRPTAEALPSRPLLEDYRARDDAAAECDWLTAELVAAEFYIRTKWGDRPEAAEYRARFPVWEDELSRAFDEIQAELASELSTAANATTDSQDDAATEPLPERVGRYGILRLLGRGGMGHVYLAWDDRLNRQVALKVPLSRLASSRNAIERFRREAHAAGGLQHPNICPIFEFGEDETRLFIVMAFIDGQPLSQTIGDYRERHSQREIASLVRTIAGAMQVAHEKGVIHRDLKPGNIMLTPQGSPIITDFGLASLQVPLETEPLSAIGELLGTPAYMSPEQMQADLGRIGPASDVYCLGVILYELLTGQRPFNGSSGEVAAQVLRDSPQSPQTLRPEVDDGLNELCVRMLAKSPDERPASMTEATEILDAYLNGEVIASPKRLSPKSNGRGAGLRSSTIESPRHPVSRGLLSQKWKPLLGSLLLLGVAAAVIVLTTNRGTVEIESFDPSVTFRITRNGKTVAGPKLQVGKKSVSYWSGDYSIEMTGLKADRYVVEPMSFEVRRGKTVVVRITEKRAITVPAQDPRLLAKIEATRETIRKINSLIMPKYESMRVVDPPPFATEGIPRNIRLRLRTAVTWMTMWMELPSRYEDVLTTPGANKKQHGVTDKVIEHIKQKSHRKSYREYCEKRGQLYTGDPQHFPAIYRYEEAECLFMILSANLNADGKVKFRDDEVGDVDRDGMPEFIDAWGNPIEWFRWPAGNLSKLQTGKEIEPLLELPEAHATMMMHWNRGIFPFKVWPLIVSPGPDEKLGLWQVEIPRLQKSGEAQYAVYTIKRFRLAQPIEGSQAAEDNIHNHDLIFEASQKQKKPKP